MSTSATSDEIRNELKATLTARRDLGPGYDDAFVDGCVRTQNRWWPGALSVGYPSPL